MIGNLIRIGAVGGRVLAALLALSCAGPADSLSSANSVRSGTSREVLIFAAASLEAALVELRPDLEAAVGAVAVFNCAGTNALAQQLLAGVRADVFLSADPSWVEALEQAGSLKMGSRVDLLGNRLVVIGHAGSVPTSIDRLLEIEFETFAVGEPASVPVGRYAQSSLSRVILVDGEPLWNRLAPRLSPMPDSPSILRLVEGWHRAIGVVYGSDAQSSSRVQVIAEIPASLIDPPIRYVGAAVGSGSAEPGIAEATLAFLQSERAASVFRAHGFVPLQGAEL